MSLEGKFVIVTGGNTGIGKATCMELAKQKATVIIASRTIETCRSAVKEIAYLSANNQMYYRTLDLASFASIAKFAEEIKRDFPKIDILINNAACMGVPLPALTEDGIEVTFGVNHLGHFYLTQLLMDTLLKCKARIINVSAMGYKSGKLSEDMLDGDKPGIATGDTSLSMSIEMARYANSKLANVYFTRELVTRYGMDGLEAVCLHPGIVQSNIWRHTTDGDKSIIQKLIVKGMALFQSSCEEGCRTTMHCVSADLKDLNGKYFNKCAPEELLPVATDPKIQSKLWICSERMVDQIEKKLAENASA